MGHQTRAMLLGIQLTLLAILISTIFQGLSSAIPLVLTLFGTALVVIYFPATDSQ